MALKVCLRFANKCLLVTLLLLTGRFAGAQSGGGSALGPVGTTWGGEHVELEVTASGATLDFDCANGTISKQLITSANGGFKVQGTFTRERPGPVRRDNPNVASAATYSGTITGDTLHLHIETGTPSDSPGDFVLVRNQPGRVLKCR